MGTVLRLDVGSGRAVGLGAISLRQLVLRRGDRLVLVSGILRGGGAGLSSGARRILLVRRRQHRRLVRQRRLGTDRTGRTVPPMVGLRRRQHHRHQYYGCKQLHLPKRQRAGRRRRRDERLVLARKLQSRHARDAGTIRSGGTGPRPRADRSDLAQSWVRRREACAARNHVPAGRSFCRLRAARGRSEALRAAACGRCRRRVIGLSRTRPNLRAAIAPGRCKTGRRKTGGCCPGRREGARCAARSLRPLLARARDREQAGARARVRTSGDRRAISPPARSEAQETQTQTASKPENRRSPSSLSSGSLARRRKGETCYPPEKSSGHGRALLAAPCVHRRQNASADRGPLL
jgi:hypothetical protein